MKVYDGLCLAATSGFVFGILRTTLKEHATEQQKERKRMEQERKAQEEQEARQKEMEEDEAC